MGDVPLPFSVPVSSQALTLLYGFKDVLEQMKEHYAEASKRGMTLVKVNIQLEIGELIMGTTTYESLARTRFLNLRRSHKDLQLEVIDMVNELQYRDAADKKNATPTVFRKVGEIGARPDLVVAAVRAIKAFKDINSVCYTVPDSTAKGLQVISLMTDKIGPMTLRGMPTPAPLRIELPSFS
jgi:hypothetical protein